MQGTMNGHRKSAITFGANKTGAPLPIYGGDRSRALEEKIEKSNVLLEQIKATQWQNSFTYVTIPTGQFRSVFLETNPHFQTCMNIIQEFNQEVVHTRESKEEMRNGPWKQRFNNQLQGLLREIVFTRDRIVQKTFSEKVCKWAIDQLEQLETAAETQHNQTMESLHAKAILARPDTAMTSITAASTTVPGGMSRLFSATSFKKRPKSGVLKGLEKNQLPTLSATNLSLRPGTAVQSVSALRPESSTYYSKVDMIRPESCINFKKIRPGSAATFNKYTGTATTTISMLSPPSSATPAGFFGGSAGPARRPMSSIIRPESAFIKEDNEDEEEVVGKRGGLDQVDEFLGDDQPLIIEGFDDEFERTIAEKEREREELRIKMKEKIRMDCAASSLQPSQQVKQLLEDYKSKARTQIPNVEPPAQRLVHYKRKKLISDEMLRLKNEEEMRKEKGIKGAVANDWDNLGWKFPKPELFLPSQQQALEKAEEELIAASADAQQVGSPTNASAAIDLTIAAAADQTTGSVTGTAAAAAAAPGEGEGDVSGIEGGAGAAGAATGEGGEKKEKEEVNIVPDRKNYVLDANSKETFVRDLNKKFEQRSIYAHYEPSTDARELRMEAKWLEGRNKELNDKRQDEERVTMIKEWATSKGRLEKEINRKIDSSVYGSQYIKTEYKKKEYRDDELRKIDQQIYLEKKMPANLFFSSEKIGGPAGGVAATAVDSLAQPDAALRSKKYDENGELVDGEEFDVEDQDNAYDDEDGGEYYGEGEEDPEDQMDGAAQEYLDEMGNNLGRSRGSKVQFAGRSTNKVDITKGSVAASAQFVAKADRFLKVDKDIDDLEYNASKEKISQIRKLYGSTIKVLESKEMEDERIEIKTESLSVYAKDRRKQSHRPFSAVISRVNTDFIRKEQIDEIDEVKKKLAKYNLSVPLKFMKNAMLVPEGNLGLDAELLPEPGEGLFSNPFMKTKKKKKKGKKKSKK